MLSIGAALAFISIDVYYTANGIISSIYLADALLQMITIMLVMFQIFKNK